MPFAIAMTWNHLLNAFSEVVLEKTLPNSSVSLYESNQSLRLIDPTQLCKVLSGFGLMISGNKEDYKVHFEMSFQIRKRGITPVNYPGGRRDSNTGIGKSRREKPGVGDLNCFLRPLTDVVLGCYRKRVGNVLVVK